MGEAVEQARADVEEQVRRHLGRRFENGVFRGGSRVDTCKQQRAELRKDRDLGQEELGLCRRQEADEILDSACRPHQHAGQPLVFLLGRPGHAARLRIFGPHRGAADRDPVDHRRTGQGSAFGLHRPSIVET
jgi:hypothetical protein